MVAITADNIPLDPTTAMHVSNGNNQQGAKTKKLSEIEMIVDRNVAPYAISSHNLLS